MTTNNTYIETNKIENLSKYLKNTKHDNIIVRCTLCKGGWHDNEFDAQRAGFSIKIFHYSVYRARHEYSECYYLTRNK